MSQRPLKWASQSPISLRNQVSRRHRTLTDSLPSSCRVSPPTQTDKPAAALVVVRVDITGSSRHHKTPKHPRNLLALRQFRRPVSTCSPNFGGGGLNPAGSNLVDTVDPTWRKLPLILRPRVQRGRNGAATNRIAGDPR